MGSMKLYRVVQDSWSRAGEADHPAICCRDGVQLDPSPPALRALFTRHEVSR
jgi:hypothetical protein